MFLEPDRFNHGEKEGSLTQESWKITARIWYDSKKQQQLNTPRSISQCHTGYYYKDIRSRPRSRFLHPIGDNGRMAKQSPLDLPGRYLDLDLDLTLKNIGKVN